MATWEDKFLDGPQAGYCSSDEGEHEEDRDEGESSGRGESRGRQNEDGTPSANKVAVGGGPNTAGSRNTGPKGVLRDWELYQQHQKFLREEKEQELIQMVKASSLSCTTTDQDEKTEKVLEELQEEMAATCDDLDDLLSDKVLEQFVKQRMQLMAQTHAQIPKFGKGLLDLKTADMFLQIIDESDHRIPVIIHIFDEKYAECVTLNECMESLADYYPQVQFCKIRADAAGVSLAFKTKGIPALLVYKGGNLVGNFVQLRDEFGAEFCFGDVENFLIENGMIEDRNNIPKLLSNATRR